MSTRGEGVFPFHNGANTGLRKREWFATFAPEPTAEQIQAQATVDAQVNPHGDTYKPRRRSRLEIISDLKYAYADAMCEREDRERDCATRYQR